MSSLFTLGDIDPLLVEPGGFQGFDTPSFVERVRLLRGSASDFGPNEVIQSSGVPYPTATISGTLTESADCATFRAYDLTKEEVLFTDGNANVYTVRVLDLAIKDETDWWTFSATIISTAPLAVVGS